MNNSDKTSERTIRARYLERINGLGKCLVLWASQYYGSERYPWNVTEFDVDRLILLLDEMSSDASPIDKVSQLFWRQMKLILSKVA